MQNIVGHLDMQLEHASVDLDMFYKEYIECTFQRSMLPGLVYRTQHSASMLIFASGRVLITGGKCLLSRQTSKVDRTCFICAKERAPENMIHDNILVLDAFSYKDQFVEYDPVVWHPCCLWLFASDTEQAMCCYGATTGNKSFIFIRNYKEHVETVLADEQKKRGEAVPELFVKPLRMYQNSYTQFHLPEDPHAVISRIWPTNFKHFIPLVYVHLLVRPNRPL
jgi:hypothetical protein